MLQRMQNREIITYNIDNQHNLYRFRINIYLILNLETKVSHKTISMCFKQKKNNDGVIFK